MDCKSGRASLHSSNDVLLACTIGDLSWLKRGLSIGIKPTGTNEEGLNGLHLAAKYGQVGCIKYILDNCRIDVDCVALSTGSNALHYSIAHTNATRSLQCTKLLLSHNGNIKCQNKLGETPLHIAAKYGHIKCVRLLLEKGADILVKDKQGQTPYNTACVHNQHECARLLRALHWADKKDSNDREKLMKDEIKKRETSAKLALQECMRQEAAEVSYNQWLEKKGIESTGQHIREETYSRSTLSSRRASRKLSSPGCKGNRQFTSTIKVNPKQEKRNLSSIGKPDKMQPYTNYPPKSSARGTAKHQLNESRSEPSKSGRSSRATVRSAASVPAGVRYYSSKHHIHQTTIQGRKDQEKTNKDTIECKETIEGEICNGDKEKAFSKIQLTEQPVECWGRTTIQKKYTEEEHEQQLRVTAKPSEDHDNTQRLTVIDHDDDEKIENIDGNHLKQDEEEIDELDFSKLKENDIFLDNSEYLIEGDEEDLFHDVGPTNSLNALSLPNTLTKDRTPAEVVQLLRILGGSARYNRSNSFSHAYSAAHRNKSHRRFSLGAIPEGQIVTSYSDEDQSASQLLDSQFLESLFNLNGGGRNCNDKNIRVASQKQDPQVVSNDNEELFGSASDGSDTLSNTSSSGLSLEESREPAEGDKFDRNEYAVLPKVEITENDVSPRVARPQSLKVVNLAWDPLSNTVQSHISEHPLSPPDFTTRSGRCTPSRKLSPPNKSSLAHSPFSSQASIRSQSGASDSVSVSPKSSSSSLSLLSSSPSFHFQQQRSQSPSNSSEGCQLPTMAENMVEFEIKSVLSLPGSETPTSHILS